MADPHIKQPSPSPSPLTPCDRALASIRDGLETLTRESRELENTNRVESDKAAACIISTRKLFIDKADLEQAIFSMKQERATVAELQQRETQDFNNQIHALKKEKQELEEQVVTMKTELKRLKDERDTLQRQQLVSSKRKLVTPLDPQAERAGVSTGAEFMATRVATFGVPSFGVKPSTAERAQIPDTNTTKRVAWSTFSNGNAGAFAMDTITTIHANMSPPPDRQIPASSAQATTYVDYLSLHGSDSEIEPDDLKPKLQGKVNISNEADDEHMPLIRVKRQKMAAKGIPGGSTEAQFKPGAAPQNPPVGTPAMKLPYKIMDFFPSEREMEGVVRCKPDDDKRLAYHGSKFFSAFQSRVVHNAVSRWEKLQRWPKNSTVRTAENARIWHCPSENFCLRRWCEERSEDYPKRAANKATNVACDECVSAQRLCFIRRLPDDGQIVLLPLPRKYRNGAFQTSMHHWVVGGLEDGSSG